LSATGKHRVRESFGIKRRVKREKKKKKIRSEGKKRDLPRGKPPEIQGGLPFRKEGKTHHLFFWGGVGGGTSRKKECYLKPEN